MLQPAWPIDRVVPAWAVPSSSPETFRKLYRWIVIGCIGTMLGLILCSVALSLWVPIRKWETRRSIERAAEVTFQEAQDGSVSYVTIHHSNTMSNIDLLLALFFLAIMVTFAAVQIGCYLVFLYRCWELVQDGQAQTTPGQAVGFLFIPFFNLYWMFVAIRGLAEDLNSYARRRNLAVREASVQMVTIHLILNLCGMVACLGFILLILNMVVYIFALRSIKNTAAGIAQAKMG